MMAGGCATEKDPRVAVETTMGDFEVVLWPETSPGTVSNFLAYVEGGFYDGLIFHRVIPGFMIQGGGFSANMIQKKPGAPIANEASNVALNKRGTLAMARTMIVDSATSQFFVNLVDNDFLNHKNTTPAGFGYCAFGEVVSGMDVVDRIGGVATAPKAGHANVPVEPVMIKSMRVK